MLAIIPAILNFAQDFQAIFANRAGMKCLVHQRQCTTAYTTIANLTAGSKGVLVGLMWRVTTVSVKAQNFRITVDGGTAFEIGAISGNGTAGDLNDATDGIFENDMHSTGQIINIPMYIPFRTTLLVEGKSTAAATEKLAAIIAQKV
jgi:hypothetical protein